MTLIAVIIQANESHLIKMVFALLTTGFPGGSIGKESACNVRDLGLIPGLGTSWKRAWQPIPALLSGESPWREEPGGLWSMQSQGVRHNWVTKHTHLLLTIAMSPEPPQKVGDSPAVADGSS